MNLTNNIYLIFKNCGHLSCNFGKKENICLKQHPLPQTHCRLNFTEFSYTKVKRHDTK